jgi:hypothetical protein
MTDRVAALARRVESDEQFLASALADYAYAEELDDQALAQRLGCPTKTLVSLRLCLRPEPEPVVFQREVVRIASRFGVDARVLAEAIRMSAAIGAMRDTTGMGEGGLLMAARDRREDSEGER